MKEKEYFAYDILDIPEDIKNMTPEELEKEIARIEREENLKNKQTPLNQAV
ncbi:MAG: hypothetical protein IJT23_08515 [Clostridia bacterium]|nr:hypothetical protein [Clostridia bacterium]